MKYDERIVDVEKAEPELQRLGQHLVELEDLKIRQSMEKTTPKYKHK